MYVLEIQKQRDLMQQLLMGSTFHEWQLREAAVTTYAAFHVDGTLQKEYYDKEALEELQGRECALWKEVQPYCFSLIKGQRTPLSFLFVFQPSVLVRQAFLQYSGLDSEALESFHFSLNCRFASGKMMITSGTSADTFTMDRTAEHAWDAYVEKYLMAKGIE